MTVIAWDGITLAADKQSTNNGYARTCTKIARVPGGLVGFCNNAAQCANLLNWFEEGRQPDKWPHTADQDMAACAVFICEETKHIHLYDTMYPHPHPEIIEDTCYAAGHGRDYALATMYLGETAKTAVEVTCQLDISCGKGIDTLTFDENP